MHMEATNVDEAVNKTNLSDYESSKPTFEYPANREATRAETESMSDGSNLDIRPDLHEEARGLLQFAAEFDPNFHPENAPRIALLCQTCHTALQTASLLAQGDKQRQQLTSEALRVRVWGMDMFESSSSTPLDELLGMASGNHTSLRCHLIGVWADIAATLEIILCFLLRQPGNPRPESCTQWRRLRIVIGLDDISSAIHDGFSLPVTFDRHDGSGDGSELLSSLIDSLGDLVDCLFDLLVTIGTIRQLHKLGFKSNISNQPPFRATEVQVADTSKKTVRGFSVSSSPVVDVVSKANPLPTSDSRKGQRMRNQGPESGLTDSESLHFSESAPQDIPRDPGESTDLSHEAMPGGPLKPQTESVRQHASPESLDTMNAPIVLGDEFGNSIETSKGASAANPSRFQKPIKFIDCHGRTFTFPFSLCCTWTGMQSLIKEGFEGLTGLDADITREFIEQGKYDLVSHFDNETIIPSLWGSVLEPGMTVRMMLYQLPPIIQPRAQPYQGTQYADPPFEYHPKPFRNASTASSNRRVHNSVNEVSRNSQDEAIAEHKDSQNVDTEMTSPVNVALGQRADAPSPIADPGRSTKETFSDIGEIHDRASYGDKKRKKKTTTSSLQSGNSGTAYEIKPLYSPRPRRLHGPVSSSAKLPKFEEPEIERNTRHSAAPPTSERDLGYAKIPMSYIDSALGGMGSPVSSYLYPASSYISQPDISDINNTKLVSPRTLSPVPSILAARLSSEPLGRSPIPAQYLDRSQGYSELKQLILDEKAARQASELAAKKLEDERRAQAEKELLAVKEIAADAAVAAAAAAERAEFTGKEAEKLAAESRKAEVVRNEIEIPPWAKPKPRAIRLKDPYKRSFALPYDLSSTWQGMKGLIDKSFLHDERIHAHIIEGHYDLHDPNGDIIPPALWENLITPGMTVELKLWPIPESSLNELENQKEPKTVRHSLISKNEDEISHLRSGDEEEISDGEPEHRGRFSKWKDRLLHPSRRGVSATNYTDVENA